MQLLGKRLLRDGWSLFELRREPGAGVEGELRFTDALAAERFLRRLATDSWNMRTLRVALADTTAGVDELLDVQVVTLLAHRIVGRWVRVVAAPLPRIEGGDGMGLSTSGVRRQPEEPWPPLEGPREERRSDREDRPEPPAQGQRPNRWTAEAELVEPPLWAAEAAVVEPSPEPPLDGP